MNQEHAPQETVAIMGQLQPMENEDETGNYERARESCTTRMEYEKKKARIEVLLSYEDVNLPVRW